MQFVNSTEQTPTFSTQFVAMKNCATLIIYLAMINCISKFDYNVAAFLIVLFIILYIQNTQNPNEHHLYQYIFIIGLASMIIDIIWLILKFGQYTQSFSAQEMKTNEESVDRMLQWNHLYAFHIMSLGLTVIIIAIKIPFLYVSHQEKRMKEY
ncbi:hypothetical protein pb186bvf_011049 [Paramecium bursaria]